MSKMISRERLNKIRQAIFGRLNSSAILVLSFLLVIVVGSFLLSLPITHQSGASVPVLDAMFTAVSATCVTGLMTICSYYDLNILGQIVVLIMIQIGGLGLMTFAALIVINMREKLEYKERSLLKDAFNKDSNAGISSYISAIFKYTMIIEAVGALILCTQMYDGTLYSMFQATFLSISAFCNAGMDIIGPSSLMPYNTNFVVNITVMTLIVLGGLGFAVWFDVTGTVFKLVKEKLSLKKMDLYLKVQTRIVWRMTVALILSGVFFIIIFEWNNALAPFTFAQKIQAAFFNSITLRTAGFYTMDYSILTSSTKIIMLVYMLIGGSPGGTAGGLKTTTFFLIIFAIYTELKGRTSMHVFKRHVHKANLIKATTIFALYMLLVFGAMVILAASESFDTLDILFEVCSAVGTVGLSIGITPMLTAIGKIVIMLLMFAGRVGPITLLVLLRANSGKSDLGIRYPKTEIMVG